MMDIGASYEMAVVKCAQMDLPHRTMTHRSASNGPPTVPEATILMATTGSGGSIVMRIRRAGVDSLHQSLRRRIRVARHHHHVRVPAVVRPVSYTTSPPIPATRHHHVRVPAVVRPVSYNQSTNSCYTPSSCSGASCCTAGQLYNQSTNSCYTPSCLSGIGVYPVCCTSSQLYNQSTNSCYTPSCLSGIGVYPVCCTSGQTYDSLTNSCNSACSPSLMCDSNGDIVNSCTGAIITPASGCPYGCSGGSCKSPCRS